MHTADKYEPCDRCHNNSDDPSRNTECVRAGLRNGIGLHHAAEKSECENDGDGEESGKEFAESAREGLPDIVYRSAGRVPILVHCAGLLCQHSLSINGSHAEESDDPHPENRAGSAGEDRAAGTDDISGTYLSCDSSGQGLEGTDAAVLSSHLPSFIVQNRVSYTHPIKLYIIKRQTYLLIHILGSPPELSFDH